MDQERPQDTAAESSPTLECDVRVMLSNKYGLHARPATMFREMAVNFSSDIIVSKDGQEVDGKSIFGLMMLCAEKGAELIIQARGPDAQEAVAQLGELVDKKFYEE